MQLLFIDSSLNGAFACVLITPTNHQPTTPAGDDYEYKNDNSDEVIQQLMQQHANLPFHKACFSTSITPQGMAVCFQEHGIDRATEVDDQQLTALHTIDSIAYSLRESSCYC